MRMLKKWEEERVYGHTGGSSVLSWGHKDFQNQLEELIIGCVETGHGKNHFGTTVILN